MQNAKYIDRFWLGHERIATENWKWNLLPLEIYFRPEGLVALSTDKGRINGNKRIISELIVFFKNDYVIVFDLWTKITVLMVDDEYNKLLDVTCPVFRFRVSGTNYVLSKRLAYCLYASELCKVFTVRCMDCV